VVIIVFSVKKNNNNNNFNFIVYLNAQYYYNTGNGCFKYSHVKTNFVILSINLCGLNNLFGSVNEKKNYVIL